MLSLAFKSALPRSVLQATVRSRVHPSARFGTLQNVLQKRPTAHSPLPLYRFSRTIITDAQTITQASSQDAWKKFAITAVRSNCVHLCLLIQVCRPLWQALSSLQKVS
jgi:hypothetical protein